MTIIKGKLYIHMMCHTCHIFSDINNAIIMLFLQSFTVSNNNILCTVSVVCMLNCNNLFKVSQFPCSNSSTFYISSFKDNHD